MPFEREYPRTHGLKIWPEYFAEVVAGRKTFEIREDDRDFRPADILNLREWDPHEREYTGRRVEVRVTYITHYAQRPDTVVLAFVPAEARIVPVPFTEKDRP